MPRRRVERVAAHVVRELGAIIEKDLTDPAIGFVTVRHAALSADLSRATVFVSVYGSADRVQESLRALERAQGYLRRELAHRLRLRAALELSVQLDPEMVTAEQLAQGVVRPGDGSHPTATSLDGK
ncbi:MAG: 30S ribosome-binding factor RbfA [Actinobacteria bacterium]|nr:30S ribosome-binding factor RbfA [Actinomycetota bacterium]